MVNDGKISRREALRWALRLALVGCGSGVFAGWGRMPGSDADYRSRVARDFAEGKTVIVDGWLLSQTEAQGWSPPRLL